MPRSRFAVPDELTRESLLRMLLGEEDTGPLDETVPGPLVREPGPSVSLAGDDDELVDREALPESIDEIEDLMGPDARFGAYLPSLGAAPPRPATTPARPRAQVVARTRAAGAAPSGAPATPAEKLLLSQGTFKGKQYGTPAPSPRASDPGRLMERGTWRGASASPFGLTSGAGGPRSRPAAEPARVPPVEAAGGLADDLEATVPLPASPRLADIQAYIRANARATGIEDIEAVANDPVNIRHIREAVFGLVDEPVAPARMISPAQADRGNAPGALRDPFGAKVGGAGPLRARDLGANPGRAPLAPFRAPTVSAYDAEQLARPRPAPARPASAPPTRRGQDIALPREAARGLEPSHVAAARNISPAQAERGTPPAPIEVLSKGERHVFPGHLTPTDITNLLQTRDWLPANDPKTALADVANVGASVRADPHVSRTADRTYSQGGGITRDDLVQLLPAAGITAAGLLTRNPGVIARGVTAALGGAAGAGAEDYLNSTEEDAGQAMKDMAGGAVWGFAPELALTGTARGAQALLRKGALSGAQRVLGPEVPNVARYANTALDEGVLPGLRTGNTYATRKMQQLQNQVGPVMAAHGQGELGGMQRAARALGRYPETGEMSQAARDVLPRTSAEAERLLGIGGNAAERREVIAALEGTATNPLFGQSTGRGIASRPTTPTAAGVEQQGIEQAMRLAGDESGPAGLHRAFAQDMLGQSATAVPVAAPTINRLNDLVPVQHLLGTRRLSPFFEAENTPTIRARLIGHALNRMVAPASKGAYRASKVQPRFVIGGARGADVGLGALLSGNQTFSDLVTEAVIEQLAESRKAKRAARK